MDADAARRLAQAGRVRDELHHRLASRVARSEDQRRRSHELLREGWTLLDRLRERRRRTP